jgi:hypothetical protein
MPRADYLMMHAGRGRIVDCREPTWCSVVTSARRNLEGSVAPNRQPARPNVRYVDFAAHIAVSLTVTLLSGRPCRTWRDIRSESDTKPWHECPMSICWHGAGLSTQVEVGAQEGVLHTSWITCHPGSFRPAAAYRRPTESVGEHPEVGTHGYVGALGPVKLAELNRALRISLDLP